MSEREAAQKAYEELKKSKNPSTFDVTGAFDRYYNEGKQSTSLAIPLDFGKSISPKQRQELLESFNATTRTAPVSKVPATMAPAPAGEGGFWNKLFAGMEKAYNFSAQLVSFGLTLPEKNNPLYQGSFDFDNIKNSWNAASKISPGRSAIRMFVGTPLDQVEDTFSGIVKTVSGGKLSGFDKFMQDHLLFGANDFNIFDQGQAERAFREQNIGRWSSFSTDVVARFVIDPTIFAGKAYKAYKAAGVAVKGTKDLQAILAGEKTGRKAERVKASFTEFLERTDGMDQTDLFRIKAVRESANPASFADILAEANKIDDKVLRHQTKADIIHWAMGDAGAATRLINSNELLAAKIGKMQDEVYEAKFFGAGRTKDGQLTFDLTNNGAEYDNVKTMVGELEDELAKMHQKLSAEAIISPNMVPTVNIGAAIRQEMAKSQTFIDLRTGIAGAPVRVLTGFFYKRPKGWIDFTDNQSVQTVDNMLNQVRGISDRQAQIYGSKIENLQKKLTDTTLDAAKKKEIKNEIKVLRQDLRNATFTVERKNALFNKYTGATDPAERARAYQEIEAELFTTIARQFGYDAADVRKAWSVYSDGRAKAHNIIRERAYTAAVDPVTGGPVGGKVSPIIGSDGTPLVIPLPLNETQLVKQLPTLNIQGMYDVLNKYTRAQRFEKGGKVYRLYETTAKGRQAGDELLQGLDSLLKFEVLARVGYPVRNVTEGFMRIMTTVGPMAILARFGGGSRAFMNNLFNKGSIDEIYDNFDKMKLEVKRAELDSMRYTADDTAAIEKEIAEIDAMLDGTIPIKDKFGMGLREIDGITYEDALGATPERAKYIRERFIANAAQIVDNNFMESNRRLKNFFETNGDWVVIKGSDVNWEDAYLRVINRQVRNSKLTSILLQAKPREQLVQEAEIFLLKTADGRKIMKNLAMGRDARSIAEANMQNVEDLFPPYVPDALREIASKRALTLDDVKKYFSDPNRRPDVNAAQVGMANGTSVISRGWGNFLENFYRLVGEIPETELVRNPLFVDLYRKRMKASIQNAIETYPGDSIPPTYIRKLENQARQWARAELRRTLYDTSERVEAAHTLKYIFPFFGAFADVAEKWGKIVLNDPSTIRKLETVYDSPDRMGMVEERDGITYINIPGEWAKRLTLGIGNERPLAIPKPSLNLIFQGGSWWNPGAGWFVQYPMSTLVKAIPDLERNRLVKEVLPYGADGTGVQDFLIQSAGARKVMAIFDADNPTRKNLTVLIAAEENQKYDAGLRDTVPSAKEIDDRVKGILAMEAAARFVLPFATNTRSPYQYYIDEFHRLREEDPLTASDKFYDMYGDDYYLFTTSLSKNNTGIAATIEADKRSKQLADLIAKAPEYGWFIVGDANQGEFSPTVYQKQRETAVAPGSTTKFRESQDPYEAIKETQTEKGWILYNKGMDLIEAQRIARGLKSLNSKGAEDLKEAKESFVAAIEASNPEWRDARGVINTGKVMKFLRFAQGLTNDPRVANRADIATISTYIAGREAMRKVLATRESQSLDNEDNADIKEAWDEFTGALIDQDITFNRIYTRILEKDDLRKGL